MSIFLFIILLIIIIMMLVPVLKVAWAVHRLRRQSREFFNNNGDAYDEYRRQARRAQQPPRPRRGGKKIGRDVGEYVDFEEVPTYGRPEAEAGESNTNTTVTESQIEDVEWEDI